MELYKLVMLLLVVIRIVFLCRLSCIALCERCRDAIYAFGDRGQLREEFFELAVRGDQIPATKSNNSGFSASQQKNTRTNIHDDGVVDEIIHVVICKLVCVAEIDTICSGSSLNLS